MSIHIPGTMQEPPNGTVYNGTSGGDWRNLALVGGVSAGAICAALSTGWVVTCLGVVVWRKLRPNRAQAQPESRMLRDVSETTALLPQSKNVSGLTAPQMGASVPGAPSELQLFNTGLIPLGQRKITSTEIFQRRVNFTIRGILAQRTKVVGTCENDFGTMNKRFAKQFGISSYNLSEIITNATASVLACKVQQEALKQLEEREEREKKIRKFIRSDRNRRQLMSNMSDTSVRLLTAPSALNTTCHKVLTHEITTLARELEPIASELKCTKKKIKQTKKHIESLEGMINELIEIICYLDLSRQVANRDVEPARLEALKGARQKLCSLNGEQTKLTTDVSARTHTLDLAKQLLTRVDNFANSLAKGKNTIASEEIIVIGDDVVSTAPQGGHIPLLPLRNKSINPRGNGGYGAGAPTVGLPIRYSTKIVQVGDEELRKILKNELVTTLHDGIGLGELTAKKMVEVTVIKPELKSCDLEVDLRTGISTCSAGSSKTFSRRSNMTANVVFEVKETSSFSNPNGDCIELMLKSKRIRFFHRIQEKTFGGTSWVWIPKLDALQLAAKLLNDKRTRSHVKKTQY